MPASVPVHRIGFELPWPPHTSYAYVLGTDEPLLVDAGAPGDDGWKTLATELEGIGLAPADIEHVLVTHPHTDHAGQVERLLEAGDPTVYAPIGVRKRLSRPPDDLAEVVQRNAIEIGHPDPASPVADAVDSLKRNRRVLPPDGIDVEVAFGEPFDVGELSFEAIHAPGHQANQAAFYDDGRLFAGDALAEPFRTAALHTGLDRGCTDAIDAFYRGRENLSAYEIDRVYPGHGPVFDDATAAIERDLSELDALVESCHEVVASVGSATAYEVTAERVDDPQRLGFSVYESVGALARLERRGEIDSSLVGDVRYYEPSF